MRMFSDTGRPRAPSSARHPRNGSTTIESIPEVPDEHSSTNRSRNVTTSSSSRPTLGWPFQSHSHNRSISGSWARHSRSASRSRSGSNSTPRRSSRLSSSRRSNGWMSLRPASSLVGDDIIPDYVINYIHGETPESLARKRERAAASAHNAEVHRGQHIQSQAAELDDVNFPRDMEKNAAGGARGTLQGLTTGWKGGITLNIIMASVVLLAAVVCIALAASRGLFTGQEPGVIAQGKCSRVSSLSAGLNALVNVLGLVLVAGANYAAQTLASPTRSDVDRAHAKQGWLDIGIPSLRNLAGISKGRAALSASVLVIALGGHLVYNSLTFITSTDSATCTLFLNGPLLAAIAGLYLLFAVALTATLMGVPSSSTPLVTLGDAIDSFLSEPDSSTESACLVNKADISSGRWGCGQARYWFTEPHRWGNTPSLARWIVWTVSWLLPTGMAAALVALAAMDKKDGSSTRFSSFTGTTATYALPRNIGQPGLSLLVALPQLLVAALYLATNALLSVQHLSHEFSQFSAPGASHGLRVSSSPRGVQTVALHLTLPAAWSWATMVVFAAQGLMLAQGFRVVHSDGGKAVSIGLNAVPLVVLLFLLVVVGTGVGLLSLRRAVAAAAADAWSSSEEVNLRRRGGNPLALRGGSCSAVISSRCHPAEGDAPGGDVAAWPLTWGVVTEGAGGGGSGSKVGHAAFSSQPVGVLSVAKAYA